MEISFPTVVASREKDTDVICPEGKALSSVEDEPSQDRTPVGEDASARHVEGQSD